MKVKRDMSVQIEDCTDAQPCDVCRYVEMVLAIGIDGAQKQHKIMAAIKKKMLKIQN